MKKSFVSHPAFSNLRVLVAFVLCSASALLALVAFGAFAASDKDTIYVSRPIIGYLSVFNGDVRDLPKVPQTAMDRPELNEPDDYKRLLPEAVARQEPEPNVPMAPMPGPIRNFAGLSVSDNCVGGPCGSGVPPDTNGDVGPNHYVQTVNSAFAIYSKTGTLLAARTENALFAQSGTPCDGNSRGDPIVLYDPIANRWILSNIAFAVDPSGNPLSPFYQCVAVSVTSDPVSGGWYRYSFRMDNGGTNQPPVNTINDYPKFGIWTDGCLYYSANGFDASTRNYTGGEWGTFPLNDMYAGQSTVTMGLGYVASTNDYYTMVPSNVSGPAGNLPPSGRRNYYVQESRDSSFTFKVRTVTPGPNCGGGGTLSAATLVSQSSYNVPLANIVPQPPPATSSNTLDSLGDRMMQKVQYRRVGGAESLWVTHTFRSSSSGPTGSQWAQINVTGGAIGTTPVQQQKYDPADGIYRWMSSIAADKDGNVALGYSTSSATNFPSIAYSGRLASDTPNMLPQSETQLVTGNGSQINTCDDPPGPCHRWGDYSAMSVDPDGCTFWYTNQYYVNQTNASSGTWNTRIASFRFPSCGNGTPTPTPAPSCTPGWSVGPNIPPVGVVRAPGNYFPANGRFYAMGGRSADTAGADFTSPFEYNPATNTWVTKAGGYPDNKVDNMACGVLSVSGTPQIYCVGGNASQVVGNASRVFSYNPVTDTFTALTAADDWPGSVGGAFLPGGFAVSGNKLYIIGGFNPSARPVVSAQTWQFDPNAAAGSRWLQRADLPVARGYVPAATIGSFIYTGGGSDVDAGGLLIDTVESFRYDPVANTWATIPNIPRATAETRAVVVNNKMWILGGGRVAPNPSNQVNIYDPGSNTWSVGFSFTTARRNFPADSDGTSRVFLAGGYDASAGAPLNTMEVFGSGGCGTPSTLGNISTRLRVETGNNVLIGGFIITGTQLKRVIVRAIGPSLPFAGALSDPVLELRNSSGGLIASNDNWRSNQEAEIIATTIPPSNDLESAIVATLPASNSAYTAIVHGFNNGTGIGVVEAYDLNQAVDSKLANISTRGLVQTGDNVLIGGLIVQGQSPLRVIVRAIGPSLSVPGALGNPTLELRDGNGGLIDSNDNWRSDHEAEIIATTIPPSNDLESAIVRDLTPGNYTAIVRGVSNTTGVALVDEYGLN